MFETLNDGRQINIVHISKIYRQGSDIYYESAKGSLDAIVEHFNTEQEAEDREQELQKSWLAS